MSYSIRYYAAIIVGVTGVVCGVLVSAGATGAGPGWLSRDVAATAGIISTVCIALAAWLPSVTYPPGQREEAYLQARDGKLPDDLAAKHS